jgi:hypothetical protein
MTGTVAFGPAANAAEPDIDKLVAAYSARGKARKRSRGRKRLIVVAVLAALLAAVWLGIRSDLSLPRLAWMEDGELLELRSLVKTELNELSAQRIELEAQRQWYQAKSRELEAELSSFQSRYASLEAQRAALSEQSAQLAEAMAKIDSERATLLAAQARGSSLEREIAVIGAERQALEQRWQQFADEGKQLASELDLLDRQRRALESERRDMDLERRELESLMDQRGQEASRARPSLDATSSLVVPQLDATLPREHVAVAADVVDSDALGEMRGGIMMGNGMNVAVGLTRIAAINGEQQFSSTLNIDSLGAGVDASALQNINQLVIQNGPGNVIGPSFLEGWSGGMSTIVQNSLDNQDISATTIYDVQIQDVGNAMKGLAASQALSDSLSFQR